MEGISFAYVSYSADLPIYVCTARPNVHDRACMLRFAAQKGFTRCAVADNAFSVSTVFEHTSSHRGVAGQTTLLPSLKAEVNWDESTLEKSAVGGYTNFKDRAKAPIVLLEYPGGRKEYTKAATSSASGHVRGSHQIQRSSRRLAALNHAAA
eukprot:3524452-Pleurochrysis_carterae.AAC.1